MRVTDPKLVLKAYLGALELLADAAMYIDGRPAEKFRKRIEREFKRAANVIPGFQWVRSVTTFAVWIEEEGGEGE